MKNILVISIMFLNCLEFNGQTIFKESFNFEDRKVSFLKMTTKKIGEFNFIIKEVDTDSIKLINEIKKCYSKKKSTLSSSYIFFIPKEFTNKKEEIVLEFISFVLSQIKLIDWEMNVIADENYFNLYEETRTSNNGKYKNSFLNKINSMNILKTNDNLYKLLK